MAKIALGRWNFSGGYVSSAARTALSGVMAYGSANALVVGLGLVRAWRGFISILTTTAQGSRQFFHADGKYAGLGDVSDANVKGSVFKARKVLAFVGVGLLRYNGQSLGINANSILRYVEKVSGGYAAPAYQAGHARPSAPTIYPKTPGANHSGMSGSANLVIWRLDSKTGQVSLPSLPSNILVLSNESVIVPFPAADANAQDYWGIGVPRLGFAAAPVFYELRVDLGGEVAESVLAYSRNVGALTIAAGTNVLDAAGAAFSAQDVGRRISDSGFDSWITEVVSATQVKINDPQGSAAAGTNGLIRHAVRGILRAIEIDWTSDSLQGQNFAPFDAYPPVSNLVFAGIINDTMFAEDADGILYIGVPGYIGSFPPKSAIYPTEPAILYLDGSEGVYWRFGATTLMVLSYVGGSTPILLQQVWKNAGIKFPTNAVIGMGGRIIAWTNKPVRVGSGREPAVDFALRVYKDFEGWDAQTSGKPVVCGYDADKQLEIWAYDRKIMCYHVPSDSWCAPVNIASQVGAGEYLVSCVSIGNKLQFCTNSGANLRLHKFDEGAGSTLIIKTPDTLSPGNFSTVTQLDAVLHVDQSAAFVSAKIITNFDDDDAETVFADTLDSGQANQHFATVRCNVLNAKSHSVQFEMTSAGGDCGIQEIMTAGDVSNTII